MPENEGQATQLENSQVSETAVSQVEETTIQSEGASDVIGQIGKLLNPEGNQQETKTQEEIQVETKVEPQKEVAVIDDAMIKEYPALKMYRGKPLVELGKAYQNIVKAYTENQMRLKQIEKEQVRNTLPKPSEVPDPVEKPEEFQKWLAEYTEKVIQTNKPEPEPINWVGEVQKILPKEADVNVVLDEWSKFNAKRLFDPTGNLRPDVQKFYNENPDILLDEIQSFYGLSTQAQKNKMTIQQESKNTAYKTVTNALKKGNEDKENISNAQFNAVQRTDTTSEEDVILANIFKIAQGK